MFCLHTQHLDLQDEESIQERLHLMMLLVLLSRLWGYISKKTVPLVYTCSVQQQLANESPYLNNKKNLPHATVQPEDATTVRISLIFY
jgi:hypothetical protein